jgi:PhnB protein
VNAFDALRAPGRTTPPDPGFVAQLRARLTAALAPTVPLPDRSPTMATTTPATTPVTGAGDAAPDTAGAAALVPYITVRGAAAAIDWYRRVFGARELVRYTADDGVIGHAQLAIGAAQLMLSDEHLEYGAVSPDHLGGTTFALNLDVPDVDAAFGRAVAAGAVVRREPADQPYGERSCQFVDPWGHRWMVQTTVATPTIDEIDAAMDGYTVTAPETATDARTDDDG